MPELAQKRQHISVRMFPRLVISDGVRKVEEEDIRSDMVIRLFAYLIYHHKKVCTADELADALWPGDESINPAGALKNLAYRLRQTMKKYFPDIEFIRTGRGSYRWNQDLDLKLDTDIFAQEIRKADKAAGSEAKTQHYRAAFEVYRGTFMKSIAEDPWVITKAATFENMFLETARELSGLLEEAGSYLEMEVVAREALEINPYEEDLHIALIRSLIDQNRQGAAEEQYRAATKILYDNLGIGPSQELQDLFLAAMEQEHKQETDLAVIQQELHEAAHRQGAFFCEYGVFKKIYELEARRVARMGMTIYLSLITLYTARKQNGSGPDAKDREILDRGMTEMYDVAIESLRLGDVMTRYSASQYLIMLPACPYENAKLVMERIQNNFEKIKRHAKVRIQYTLKEMEPSVEGSHGNPVYLPSTLRILVDERDRSQMTFSGRIAGIALDREYAFHGTSEMMTHVEKILNQIGKPQPGRITRNFEQMDRYVSYKSSPDIARSAEEIMALHGEEATYDVEFRSRSYSTWQGVLYEEGSREMRPFASELELFGMIC